MGRSLLGTPLIDRSAVWVKGGEEEMCCLTSRLTSAVVWTFDNCHAGRASNAWLVGAKMVHPCPCGVLD